MVAERRGVARVKHQPIQATQLKNAPAHLVLDTGVGSRLYEEAHSLLVDKVGAARAMHLGAPGGQDDLVEISKDAATNGLVKDGPARTDQLITALQEAFRERPNEGNPRPARL